MKKIHKKRSSARILGQKQERTDPAECWRELRFRVCVTEIRNLLQKKHGGKATKTNKKLDVETIQEEAAALTLAEKAVGESKAQHKSRGSLGKGSVNTATAPRKSSGGPGKKCTQNWRSIAGDRKIGINRYPPKTHHTEPIYAASKGTFKNPTFGVGKVDRGSNGFTDPKVGRARPTESKGGIHQRAQIQINQSLNRREKGVTSWWRKKTARAPKSMQKAPPVHA